MIEQTLPVQGMTCGGCAKSVRRALESLGAEVLEVSLEPGLARVRSELPRERLARAIEDAGFEVPGQP